MKDIIVKNIYLTVNTRQVILMYGMAYIAGYKFCDSVLGVILGMVIVLVFGTLAGLARRVYLSGLGAALIIKMLM